MQNKSIFYFFCRKDHKKCEFELHEVYGVDVLISTGEGKAKERESRTTVYKRTDMQYGLKMKASRSTLFGSFYPVMNFVTKSKMTASYDDIKSNSD